MKNKFIRKDSVIPKVLELFAEFYKIEIEKIIDFYAKTKSLDKTKNYCIKYNYQPERKKRYRKYDYTEEQKKRQNVLSKLGYYIKTATTPEDRERYKESLKKVLNEKIDENGKRIRKFREETE